MINKTTWQQKYGWLVLMGILLVFWAASNQNITQAQISNPSQSQTNSNHIDGGLIYCSPFC
ncbi:MAG: hypothetical protein ACRC06_11125 [Waterburya sp.]